MKGAPEELQDERSSSAISRSSVRNRRAEAARLEEGGNGS